MMLLCDKFGREIKPGDYLLYAIDRNGLRIGKVLATESEHFPPMRSPSGYLRPERWNHRAIVRGIDDTYEDVESATLCSKNGTLEYPEEALVLSAEAVPARYRELLAPVGLSA